MKCGTSSRLLEFRNRVGFGGILSSISERVLTKDGLNGDGKTTEDLETSSQGPVARRSREEIAPGGLMSFRALEFALLGFDAFGIDGPPVQGSWKCLSLGSSWLVIVTTVGLKPSSTSGCGVSIIVYDSRISWRGARPGKWVCCRRQSPCHSRQARWPCHTVMMLMIVAAIPKAMLVMV